MRQGLAQGQWRQACLHNPLIITVVLIAPLVFLARGLWRRSSVLRQRSMTIVYVLLATVFVNWVYLLLREPP
jgi:cell shape-determining protein MreD